MGKLCSSSALRRPVGSMLQLRVLAESTTCDSDSIFEECNSSHVKHELRNGRCCRATMSEHRLASPASRRA